MAAFSVPSGTFSYSSTLTANAADVVEFADRAGYVTVSNTGTAVMYVRADGQTAVAAAEGCLAVLPGEVQILANGVPLWFQSSKEIPQGSIQYGGGNSQTSPSSPGVVQEQRSLAGGMSNPGVVVSIISSAADTYTVSLTG